MDHVDHSPETEEGVYTVDGADDELEPEAFLQHGSQRRVVGVLERDDACVTEDHPHLPRTNISREFDMQT